MLMFQTKHSKSGGEKRRVHYRTRELVAQNTKVLLLHEDHESLCG